MLHQRREPFLLASAKNQPQAGQDLTRRMSSLVSSSTAASASRRRSAPGPARSTSTLRRSAPRAPRRKRAAHDADGRLLNGKRTAAVQRIRARFDADLTSVTLAAPGHRRPLPALTAAFPTDTHSAAGWLSAYFEQPIEVRHVPAGAPDDVAASGPTLVSRASLAAVCAWFPGMAIGEARLRFRTTLEIDRVPAFWEDRLFGDDDARAVGFRIGDISFAGSGPCARCVVPARDPRSGEGRPDFARRFVAMRRSELPAWAARARFDHFYRFATNTRVATSERGARLTVGDPLILEPVD